MWRTFYPRGKLLSSLERLSRFAAAFFNRIIKSSPNNDVAHFEGLFTTSKIDACFCIKQKDRNKQHLGKNQAFW